MAATIDRGKAHATLTNAGLGENDKEKDNKITNIEDHNNTNSDQIDADVGTTNANSADQYVMDTSDFPSPKRLAAIMVGLFLAMFTNNLDATIIATAIPYITDQFHTIKDVAWYVSATFLTFAAFQSTWGKALKYFPIKPTFLLALFLFELGSLICGVAPNSTALIVGRAIAGVGGAGVSAGAFTLIAFSAPPAQVPAYMGGMGATYAAAALLGPLLGGVLTQHATWRWCFYLNLPFGGITGLIIIFFYRAPAASRYAINTPVREKFLQMDIMGSILIIGATVCYLLAFQWAGISKSWSDSSVIGTIVGFVLLTAAFCINEWKMDSRALLQPSLLKNRRIWSNQAHIFCISGGLFVLIYNTPIYFQSVKNTTPLESGIRNLPIIIGSLFSLMAGAIVTVYGKLWAPLMAAGAAVATIGSGLIYTWDIDTGAGGWIGYQALTGIGTGLAMQIPMMANQAAVPVEDMSTVMAMTLFFQIIGGSFCVSAGQAAFSNTMLRKLKTTAPMVDPQKVLNTGAAQFRSVFPAEDVPGILEAYMAGLKVAFALAIALIGLSFLLALVPRWDNLRPAQDAKKKVKEAKTDKEAIAA
jgi:MFS family permease